MKICNLIKAMTAAAACISVCSCEPHVFTIVEFTETEDISLRIKGAGLLEYKAETHQLGFNRSECEFRVHDDDMANYFIIKCNEMPSATGQKVTADIEYTTPDDVKTRNGIEFEVANINDSNGKIWLWNQKYQIGAVVMALQ